MKFPTVNTPLKNIIQSAVDFLAAISNSSSDSVTNILLSAVHVSVSFSLFLSFLAVRCIVCYTGNFVRIMESYEALSSI